VWRGWSFCVLDWGSIKVKLSVLLRLFIPEGFQVAFVLMNVLLHQLLPPAMYVLGYILFIFRKYQ
jgi:hypothetical protein